uniref:Uncharacterized protein n=1 Tax=Gallid alphaherpesvirus 2 TaxID=10390 RepID=D2Y5R6_9ALPH|nr:hypothetical protein [Gallid alphaherpesvirus 2]
MYPQHSSANLGRYISRDNISPYPIGSPRRSHCSFAYTSRDSSSRRYAHPYKNRNFLWPRVAVRLALVGREAAV